jgi:hypothetical protein
MVICCALLLRLFIASAENQDSSQNDYAGKHELLHPKARKPPIFQLITPSVKTPATLPRQEIAAKLESGESLDSNWLGFNAIIWTLARFCRIARF